MKITHYFIKTLAILGLASSGALAQLELFPNANQKWVDSVFKTLTVDQKIGQLMMPRANYNATYDTTRLNQIVRDYHVGGLVFFAGNPSKQAVLVNKLQAMAKVPMLIGMDLEWGLSMRLDSTTRFPYQMALGAMQGNTPLLEEMGYQIALQCKRIGVHVNYAPVVDINNNPNNPVINFRSFGENKYQVTQKAIAYMKGLQRGGVITSAKHFPGHGDTGTDSHYDLPLISHNRTRLDSLELYPYRELIKNGLQGVMVAHLNIPSLDTTKNLASTLSRKVVTDLLRKELNFKGLVFTDAMDMQGAVKFFPEGTANVKAILAGNDILETFVDVPAAFNAIKKALLSGEISQSDIDERVKRILLAKSWAGLDKYKPIDTKNLIDDLNPRFSDLLNRQLAVNTVTLLRNKKDIIPLQNLDTLKIASLVIGTPAFGSKPVTDFQKMLGNYTAVEHFNLDENSADSTIAKVEEALKSYNLVIMGVNGQNIRPAKNYNILPKTQELVKRFSNAKTIITLFSNPYTLGKFENLESAAALVQTFQETPHTQEAAAQAIFGATPITGKLPVTVNTAFKYNDGISTKALQRFEYTVPEAVGIDSKYLGARIDSIVTTAIDRKATPGAVVLVAKNGKVIFHKAYGKHTYEGNQKVALTDLYDLASVTKISTSVAAMMRMSDEGKFSLSSTMGDMIPDWKNSNKAGLIYKDILTHQARLRAWIPFWQDCIDSTKMLLASKVYQDKIAAHGYPEGYKITFWEKLFSRKKAYARIEKAIQSDKKLWAECVNISTQPTIWKHHTFAAEKSNDYSIQVAENLWIHKDYHNVLYKAIEDSPLREKKEYVYSDLSYYMYPQIIPRLTGKDWESFLKDTFYQPLGATTLTYNARLHYDLNRIVPTEYDSLFRKTLIHGRVHDEGAAMLNGISGHAGLFGNANDLAKLMQMYLQKGYYGGKRFIKESTLNEWTSYPFSVAENSRRGIGFDKPDRKKPGISAAPSAPASSFGHSGFTGTYTWVDPDNQLVYVFLANRVYPTRNNSKLSDLNVRTNINEVIYDAIKRGIKK
ncbi:glycoside hydrolase family 3 N-terminal domain-containing protein [Flectobacillus rivi]|uniref:beta-N-acetylhexosaminidase n=1 Tax=Flectobacillus rivi TaxID=2984209 RepID=A0ABT6Z6M7_9BACT|nr:glycoside hydrolase family 3 N-terminal domain-containing protein [Flectobacillus rivi]MDI9876773.1 glycoside hydrolase family 3 N-terminal domain-containing protein [Flectobacillus rivi]